MQLTQLDSFRVAQTPQWQQMVFVSYSKTSLTQTRLTQTLGLHGRMFLAWSKVLGFTQYTEMPTDNTDLVSIDFLINTDSISGPSITKVHRLTRTK